MRDPERRISESCQTRDRLPGWIWNDRDAQLALPKHGRVFRAFPHIPDSDGKWFFFVQLDEYDSKKKGKDLAE